MVRFATMEIIGIQFDVRWQDPSSNRRHVDRLVGDAHIRAPALVVLPEMFACGFSMDVGAVADYRRDFPVLNDIREPGEKRC